MRGQRQEHECREGIEGKMCTVCLEWQPLSQYNVRRASQDGLAPLCRACEVKRHHAYYETHTAEAKARARKWVLENPGARAAVLERYNAAHTEERALGIQRWHQWRKDHAAEYRASCYRWAREHPDKIKAMKRATERRHVDRVRLAHNRRRAIQNAAPGARYTTVAMVKARWEMFGDRCWICGAPATATDHVKPIAAGGGNWPCNLRPICKNCNSSKGAKWPFYANLRQTSRLAITYLSDEEARRWAPLD